MLMRPAGYANPSRLRQRLHPGGYIDTIAINSAVFLDDITEVDTDAKLHLAVIRQFGITFGKLSLDLNGTVHSIHDTGEVCQDVVADLGRVINYD